MKIQKVLDEKKISRFYQGDEESYLEGHLYDFSDELVLINTISHTIHFDSFIVARGKDITNAKISPHHDFLESVFRLRKESRPEPPPIDLSSMTAAINSIAKMASVPFIAVHIKDDDVCWIGQIVKCNETELELAEVNCDGVYIEESTAYPLADITYVCFDGPYEEALWLVNQELEAAK